MVENGNGGAKFDGYVKAKLEDIEKKLDKMDGKMDKLDECVDRMKVRVACIGGTVSLVVTIVVILLKDLLAK
jgi:hypothetical protein